MRLPRLSVLTMVILVALIAIAFASLRWWLFDPTASRLRVGSVAILETLVATTCRRSNAAPSRFLNSCEGDILLVFPSAAALPVREWSEIPWS